MVVSLLVREVNGGKFVSEIVNDGKFVSKRGQWW